VGAFAELVFIDVFWVVW